MVITYYGSSFVKLQAGDLTVGFNPVKEPGPRGRTVSFGADIALASIADPRFSHFGILDRGGKTPWVIDGPGEYEISGVFVQGFGSLAPDERLNTVYLLFLDGISVVHLGFFSSANLTAAAKEGLQEALGPVDLLFIPIGGAPLLDQRQAATFANEIQAKIVVPVNYADERSLQNFLKEMGEEKKQAVESFNLKKKDLTERVGEVVVVQS